METPPLDVPIILASLLMLGVLVSSAYLWIRQVQKPQDLLQPVDGVAAWPIGWVNFGVLICAMIIAVFVAQQIGFLLLIGPNHDTPLDLTPWLAVASVVMLQGPMIGIFWLARRFYPGHFSGSLSSRQHTFSKSFKVALPLFIMLLPLVWLSSMLWSGVLSILRALGLVEAFEPQPLITLFQAGGELLPILLLVAMAVIVAPIVEEIIFRGCIYRFLKSQMTLLPAQMLSGAFFALLHGNLMSFLPLVVVGILLARVYEKSGSIGVAIWFHAFFNAFSLSMLFITGMSDAIPK